MQAVSIRRQRKAQASGDAQAPTHKLLTHKRSSSFGPDVVAIRRSSGDERSVSTTVSASCSEVILLGLLEYYYYYYYYYY